MLYLIPVASFEETQARFMNLLIRTSQVNEPNDLPGQSVLSGIIIRRFLSFGLLISLACGYTNLLFANELPKPPASVIAAEQSRVEAMAMASKSTVAVFGVDGQGGGSGVVISSDGYVVTNFHVSSPFGSRMRCGLSDGKLYDAVVVGIDPTGDLALIKMYGRVDFPVAKIGNSDDCRVGQWCFAAGNPFVLATNLQPTLTFGLISGIHRYQYPANTILEYTDCLQTDAAINPGNSGGPLFDAEGNLIGINGRCSFEKRGRVNVGVGYAISVNQVKNFLGDLKSGRVVDHATLGFTVNTNPEGKIVVSNILEHCDAYRRGLRYGDEILQLSGREIATVNQLKNITGIFPNGWRLSLKFKNEEGVTETWIRLPNLHSADELDTIVKGGMEDGPEIPKQKRPEDEERPKGDEQPNQDRKPTKKNSSPPDKSTSKANDPLADRVEARDGFSNYYFNRVELQRLIDVQQAKGRWSDVPANWRWTAKLAAEPTVVQISVNDQRMEMVIGQETSSVGERDIWSEPIEKKTLNSLLIGVRLWQRWMREGPRAIGDATYIGQRPVIGLDSLCDLTRILVGDVEARFFTSIEDGAVRLIEVQADPDFDPAEIYFSNYHVQEGRSIPQQIRLQFGMDRKTVLQIDLLNFEKPKSDGGSL